MSKHYLLNVTWRCPSNCPECWVRNTIMLDRRSMSESEHTAEEWIEVLRRDKPDTLDIAGGEPFAYKEIIELIEGLSDIKIGLSTNTIYQDEILRLCDRRLDNVISINMSFHPNIMEWNEGYFDRYRGTYVSLKAAGYPVFCSIVDWEDNVEKAAEYGMSKWASRNAVNLVIAPFEDMDLVEDPSNLPLVEGGLSCDGGKTHKVFTPGGNVFPCLTTLRSHTRWERCLGNVFDEGYDPKKLEKIEGCSLYCYDYYVLKNSHPGGEMWGVNPRPIKGEEE